LCRWPKRLLRSASLLTPVVSPPPAHPNSLCGGSGERSYLLSGAASGLIGIVFTIAAGVGFCPAVPAASPSRERSFRGVCRYDAVRTFAYRCQRPTIRSARIPWRSVDARSTGSGAQWVCSEACRHLRRRYLVDDQRRDNSAAVLNALGALPSQK